MPPASVLTVSAISDELESQPEQMHMAGRRHHPFRDSKPDRNSRRIYRTTQQPQLTSHICAIDASHDQT